jgi:hypothetical protein
MVDQRFWCLVEFQWQQIRVAADWVTDEADELPKKGELSTKAECRNQ